MQITVHEPLEYDVLAAGEGFTEGPVSPVTHRVRGRHRRRPHPARGRRRVVVVATPAGGPNGLALETPTDGHRGQQRRVPLE